MKDGTLLKDAQAVPLGSDAKLTSPKSLRWRDPLAMIFFLLTPIGESSYFVKISDHFPSLRKCLLLLLVLCQPVSHSSRILEIRS